ncbi:DUF4300 family protein [Sporosarcina limicola]|uniref:DUF4300 domain-containing protein n=1 Tax=Sporosarcina limicola TaxID=34101 RepID=A0A927MLN9_9BACL|nr:DUF4300 family protein [Sporosarcina limicola]MBE1556243.1 hypothetical protein [Sporosarcina limicola]
MKSKKALLIICISCILLITGCGDKGEVIDKPIKQLTYSNLTDRASQNELTTALIDANIPKKYVDNFIANVVSFQKTVGKERLTKGGYETIDGLEPTYDEVSMIDSWKLLQPDVQDVNCRLTAFELLQDEIVVKKSYTGESFELFMDADSFENSPQCSINSSDWPDFSALFGSIPTENTKDIQKHLAVLQKSWKEREISFKDNDKISLVSVVFHAAEDKILFIGHCGVLIRKDDEFLFVEKVSFQMPYQVDKFKSKQELNDYLMHKYDVSYNQPSAKPFIIENDQLIEGYRSNPDNPADRTTE